MNVPVVAIIGRPNVGKSALFNRIVGDHSAIVSEEAGTTRDRHFALAEWNRRQFWLVDTGGLTDDPHIPMDVEIKRQVLEAIGEADLLLMVVDAKAGLHPSDSRVLDLLRESRKPWLLVANKVDDPASTDYYDGWTSCRCRHSSCTGRPSRSLDSPHSGGNNQRRWDFSRRCCVRGAARLVAHSGFSFVRLYRRPFH